MSTKEEIHDAGSGASNDGTTTAKQNQVGSVMLFGVPIVSLVMDGKERLCLAQISSTLLKEFSYNEIHNRRVALGINCVQCTPVQLEILRRAGAMPVTSRRCGMITRREAERLCKSFLGDHAPPQLPENFAFDVYHECGWGCRGSFVPSRYNSSRAKCIRCSFCQLFFSPNKFIFHSHRLPESRYVQPDAANFNSWRRHMKLCGDPPEEANAPNTISDMATAQIVHAWEDVKAMFNGGTRKRLLAASVAPSTHRHSSNHHHHRTSTGSDKGNSAVNRSNHATENSTHSGGNSGHSRNGGSSHPGKKETGAGGSASAAIAAVAAAQHAPQPPPAGYNQDAPSHPSGFLHQPQNPFLNVANPLLSPTGRFESIWNPALSAAVPGAGQSSRPCPLPGSPPFPALPLHPLSIPWLRRPLFPFSHPFGPTLINDPSGGGGVTAPEKLANLAVARQNQSAFKPVSRSMEPLFHWLNGSSLGAAAGAMGFATSTAATSLPEDLSVNSIGQTAPGASTSGSPGSHVVNSNQSNPSFNLAKHLDSTANGGVDKSHRAGSTSSKHHQIHILNTHQNESEDEENVDIESTGETEECSSTSSVWVSSTTPIPSSGAVASATPKLSSPYNNNNNTIIAYNKRKRVMTCYSSEEDVDEDHDSSDNPDDTISVDHYDEIRPCSGGSKDSKRGKRKRLWVNEIIANIEDAKVSTLSMNKNQRSDGKHNLSTSTRILREARD